jgi:hypothetical protein
MNTTDARIKQNYQITIFLNQKPRKFVTFSAPDETNPNHPKFKKCLQTEGVSKIYKTKSASRTGRNTAFIIRHASAASVSGNTQ